MTGSTAHDLWRRYLNPDFVDLLEAFDFGRRFVRAEGTRLYDDTGQAYLDFLAGFGVHNIGHNHPRIVGALREALGSQLPSMLNIDAPLPAGHLAERLTQLTDERLCRTAFGNSGAEVVDIAVKAAWAATGRKAIVFCQGAYHGLSVGSLSLMGHEEAKRPFVGLLEHVCQVPFDDLAALEQACRQHEPAAFVVEPIQAEGGVKCPAETYLEHARRICRKHGALLVVDEIQTGLGRTGRMFATDCARVRPDILLVGKALSGGMVPIAAAMMTADVWKRAFAGPHRCKLTSSTFAGGALAATAGMAALGVLSDEQLPRRAAEMGRCLLGGLSELAGRHDVVKDVRGRGLLIGVELAEPSGLLIKAAPRWARLGLYAQVISALLLRDHCIITQPCSLAPRVLRIEPPLTIGRQDVQRFLDALDSVLSGCPDHGSAVVAAFRKTILKGKL